MDGVAEVAWPIISSTATTVFAFVPLMFWPGLMGEFMYYLPLTVVICLCSSLFIALVINPTLCSVFMALPKEGEAKVGQDNELEAIPNNALYRIYGRVLRTAVRWPVAIVVASVMLFVGTFVAFAATSNGVEFFPSVTPEQAYVNITLPDGSNVEASDRVVRMVERILQNEVNVRQYVADVGAGNGDQMSFGSGGTASHRSRISVDFFPRDEQQESAYDTIARIREALHEVPGCTYEVVKAENGPPTGLPVSIEIVGSDYVQLGRIAQEMAYLLREVPGVVDLKDDFESGRPEITVDVDRDAAAAVNVSVREIANTVRAAINGIEASTYREDDDEMDIVIRLSENNRDSIEDVAYLTVSNSDGDQIPLTEIADIQIRRGWGSIRHVDGNRVVSVTADVAAGFQDMVVLGEVQALIREQLELPSGYALDFTGQNQEQAEAQAFLGRALLAGLLVIALILITQFNSVSQPMIILASVMLSLLGVLWNLMARGAPFNIIMTGMGIISLAGVVVNNAIVLIDYINQLKERGLPVTEAVWRAGMVRFRPVMLTAITTALSLMPTVLGFSLDVKNLQIVRGGTSVEMWGPMANAVVTGLLVATFLTLIAVPAMYRLSDTISDLLDKAWRHMVGKIFFTILGAGAMLAFLKVLFS
ncbi:MAG: multidrug efflux pump subunit AcrB [Bradymonadia bacterium]|jgi:multidrug efflux pump subunit AcrB